MQLINLNMKCSLHILSNKKKQKQKWISDIHFKNKELFYKNKYY